MRRQCRINSFLLTLVLALATASFAQSARAADEDNPKPVQVIGPVEVGNLPAVSGNVSVDNFPVSQRVVIDGVDGPPVPVVGGVFLIPDPSGRPNSVTVNEINDEVPVYVVGGTVSVENLDNSAPERVRGGQDVIVIESGTSGLQTFSVPPDVTLTDLVVYNAGAYRSCMVELCEQRPDGCHLFFSFEPDQGLNSINLNTGIDGHTVIRVGQQGGGCGVSLLWSGFSNTP